jgi:hypothetical protein
MNVRVYHPSSLFLLVFLFNMILASCTQPIQEESLEKRIEKIENELFDQDGVLVTANADELIRLYEVWADSLPQDSLSPEYLFIAADLSINLGNINRTMRLLDKVIYNYEGFENRGICMFLKGFVFEEQLNDTASARKQYEAFLIEYPEHDFADDANLAIKNLGKTAEDLIREFESGNE